MNDYSLVIYESAMGRNVDSCIIDEFFNINKEIYIVDSNIHTNGKILMCGRVIEKHIQAKDWRISLRSTKAFNVNSFISEQYISQYLLNTSIIVINKSVNSSWIRYIYNDYIKANNYFNLTSILAA